MRIQLVLTVLLTMLSANVEAGDSEKPREHYLCIAEQRNGFWHDKTSKHWNSTTFNNPSKYVISRSTQPTAAFQITVVGKSAPRDWCKEGFNEAGFLSCGMIWGDFTYNKNNGRFIRTSPFGYIEVGEDLPTGGEKKITDDETNTPYMEIGKCSLF
ncbi:MAG: hypothetical protein H8K03_21345 [Nitrospira sp.]